MHLGKRRRHRTGTGDGGMTDVNPVAEEGSKHCRGTARRVVWARGSHTLPAPIPEAS
jgi:hypothetical protein